MTYTEELASLRATIEAFKGDINEIKKTLSGNGQPGMEERLTRLEERHSQLFDIVEQQSNSVGELSNIVGELTNSVEMQDKSPSVLSLIKSSPIKAIGTALGSIVVAVSWWLIMYAIISIESMSQWLYELLNIPTP